MQVLLAILAIAGVIVIAITIMTFVNIRLVNKAALLPSSDPEPPADANEWARNNDFEFLGNFTMNVGFLSVFISAWRHAERPSFFCQYVVRTQDRTKKTYDLVTEFASNISLTTGSMKDGNSLPRPPSSYMQTFSNMSFDDRWYEHIESENFLMDQGQAQLIQINKTFEESLLNEVHAQAEFIRTIPFWALRGAYWHFVRGRLWHNKSIQTQHERGMIKLPNELSE